MPRAKPPNPSPVFTVYPVSLSPDQRAKTVELLGYPEHDFSAESPGAPDLAFAIRCIEQSLALCSQGARHLDSIPRSVHYRQVASSIRKKTEALLAELCGLSDYYRDALNQEGADFPAVTLELGALRDAAVAMKETYAGGDSRGRGKEVALKASVQQLRTLFRKYTSALPKGRATKGSFVSLSEFEAAETEFLKFTLLAVKAISKERAATKLARLLRDPACKPTSPASKKVPRNAPLLNWLRLPRVPILNNVRRNSLISGQGRAGSSLGAETFYGKDGYSSPPGSRTNWAG